MVAGAQRTFEMIEMDGGVDSVVGVGLGSWGDRGRLSEIQPHIFWIAERDVYFMEISTVPGIVPGRCGGRKQCYLARPKSHTLCNII